MWYVGGNKICCGWTVVIQEYSLKWIYVMLEVSFSNDRHECYSSKGAVDCHATQICLVSHYFPFKVCAYIFRT
jgi:hypothetical protein